MSSTRETNPASLRRFRSLSESRIPSWAIIAYEHAELVYLGEADSVHRALALNGRGLVYLHLAATERSQEKLLLGQAVLRSALEVFDSNTHRQEHAMVQNNLGEAHLVALDLGIGDREDHLARAEDCFKAALEVYTPDEFPDYNGLVAQNLDRLLELRDAMIRDDDP